jgi:hypothetical protein
VVVVVTKLLTVTVLVETMVSTIVEVSVNVMEMTGEGVPLYEIGVQLVHCAWSWTAFSSRW